MPTHLIGTDAFQECDTVGITRSCTKHNYLVKDAADLPRVMHEAFRIATSGRPGPVLVDVPKDVQFASAPYRDRARRAPATTTARPRPPARDRRGGGLIAQARRPILYTGGGVINSGPARRHGSAGVAR